MKSRREIFMPNFCSRRFPFHYYTALNLLQKLGVDLNRVELMAIGTFQNYKGEIHNQEPAPGTPIKAETRIMLEVGYPGGVDEMPYQYFYGLRGVTERSDTWEDNARRFMAPFDAGMIRRLSDAKYQTLKFNFSFIELDFLKKFLEFYDFDLTLADSPEELQLWMNLMPQFYIWGGNAKLVEFVLKLIFELDFKIVESIRSTHEIPAEIRYRLGSPKDRLGKEIVLGNSFSDFDSAYEVAITIDDVKILKELLPGGKTRAKLDRVLGYCMPSNLTYRVSIKTERKRYPLGEKEVRPALGYSTYL